MPSKKRIQTEFIDRFICERTDISNLAGKTISKYRVILTKALESLDKADLNYNPSKIGKIEIQYLRKHHFVGNTAYYNRWKLSIFGEWLKYYGNTILDRMKIPWPSETPIKPDWMDELETIKLKRAARGIERLVVHLELDLGLRRIDMYRLKLSDIHGSSFEVNGKGRCGGKRRTVSFSTETSEILNDYLMWRQALIDRVSLKNARISVPDALLIYEKGARIGQYQLTAIDNMVLRVAKRAGISRPITNHTLRRTCGRMLHRAGVDIEEISNILGHSETRTTMRYLGLKLDDQKMALSKRDAYLKNKEQELINKC